MALMLFVFLFANDAFCEMGDKKQTVQVRSGPLYTPNTHTLSFKRDLSDGMKLSHTKYPPDKH